MDKRIPEKTLDGQVAHEEGPDQLRAEVEYLSEQDPNIEDRILRKCDFHILPWLFGIWLCAFIDRSNIGNARIDGLVPDLKLTGNKFNIALGMLLYTRDMNSY